MTTNPAAKIIGGAKPWLTAQARLRGVTRVGTRGRVYGKPIVHNSGRMIIGDRVQIFSQVATTELVTGPNGLIEIGAQCLIMDGTTISANESVVIGDNCLFGRHSQILDCAFHYVDPDKRLESPPAEPVVIGENVWLASRVTILPGVTIGAGSAVAAGAVVAKDVPERTLVGGVPARVIREI